jgi:predicted N-acetyltransferase YhbS
VEFYSKTRGWNQYDPHITTVIQQGNRVIAHAAAIDKLIRIGSDSVRAAGVMNVFVLPAHRNNGYANIVVRAALEEALAQGFGIGLLFCKKWLEQVYRNTGWHRINGRSITRIVAERELPLREHIISMYYPLRMKTLPAGDIHLEGNEW